MLGVNGGRNAQFTIFVSDVSDPSAIIEGLSEV